MSATLPIKSRDKVKEMLNYLRSRSPRDALLFQTGVNTALRISDLLTLQVRHVSENNEIKEYIDIKEQKTGKSNRIKITSTLSIVLKAYIERYGLKTDDYLFFRIKHDHGKNLPIGRDRASKILVAAAKACNIDHCNTRSMRQTHAYHVYMASKKNIGLVQKLLNHTQPSVTLRYIGVSQSEMDEGRELVSF